MTKFDGLALAVNDTARMIIQHPTKAGALRLGETENFAYIELLSTDSAKATEFERGILKARLGRRNRNAPMTPEELEDEQTERLTNLTVGWALADLAGNPLDVVFTPADARALYKAPAMRWLREQVDQFVADRANFTKGSSTTSSPSPSTSSASIAS